jgi:hypothetical protein
MVSDANRGTELPRIRVDFAYGGRWGDEEIVYLHAKQSVDRHELWEPIREQFEALGLVPGEGLKVVLYDLGADANEEDVICDMEVEAELRWREGWEAVFRIEDLRLIPSAENE